MFTVTYQLTDHTQRHHDSSEPTIKDQKVGGGPVPGNTHPKASACNAGDPGSISGSGRSLEKEMATHSSILACRIPRMEEPGRLQFMSKSRTRLSDFPFTFSEIAGIILTLISLWNNSVHKTNHPIFQGHSHPSEMAPTVCRVFPSEQIHFLPITRSLWILSVMSHQESVLH